MSNELPKGWARTKLGQICSKPQYGWTCRAAKNGKIKYLRTSDISEGKIDWQSVPYCEEIPDDVEKYQVYPDDILVARAGSVGVSHRVRDTVHEAVFASYLIRFNALVAIEPRFIEFFLKSHEYWQAISDFAAGIAIPNVNATKLASLELPLAPLDEQHRIVAKLEKLLGKVDACQQRLAKIPVMIKRFRQSVLAAACSGRLTADWRQENSQVEPAASLIKKAQFKLSVPEDELTELPDNWSWVALGNYGRCSRGRFSVRPRNDPTYFGGPHPFIQIGDLPPDGGWIRSHNQTLNEKGLAVSKKFPKGTVIIAIVGATIGNTGLLAYDMCFTDSMVGIETDTECGNRYVELYLRSRKDEIRQTSYSSGGQPNINLEVLNPYPLALPPLSEQAEIVFRTDSLFALADQIEARFTKAKARVDQLTQSLLAKAFRGELVPQDPNDEPASILLERIKAERTKGETEGKGGDKRRLNVNRNGKGG